MTKLEKEYWKTVNYENEVAARIREKYSANDELAILRQRDSKPAEFEEYNAYCEKCKEDIKTLITKAGGTV